MKNLHILQQESIDEGRLQVRVRQKNMGTPVADARVSVSYSGDPQGKIEETDTNESGSIEAVEIATPPLEYSMSPSESQPYSEVTVTVSANGYRNITVSGVEVMPDRLSIQDIELEVLDAPGNDVDNIVIPAHTLYGDYPAKIPEPEIMPVAETGEIVLNRVVIPEYVIVHDGAPSDSTAANYYVRYKDYIKNVASSEIYATWPDATIRANVLAIMSFTLNRIYTEFYRGKGYNFNITSSTAYDHKFISEDYEMMWPYYYERRTGDAAHTKCMIVFMQEPGTDGGYKAWETDSTISMQDLAAVDKKLDFKIIFGGGITNGTATMTDGTPTFTADK